MRVALFVLLGAPPVHGAPPGTIFEVADPHDFLNRSLERRNFITELLLGYDHYPHWDGDQCIVGTPAQFQGTCKYTPEGGILGRGMKGFLHSAGLKECDNGGDCTCTGCNELNVLLGEGGNFALPEEMEIKDQTVDKGKVNDGLFTSGYHTPSAWVRAINEANWRYEQYLEARKQRELILVKRARAISQDDKVRNMIKSKQGGGFAESMKNQLKQTREKLDKKYEQADKAFESALRAWRAAMKVNQNRGQIVDEHAPKSVRQKLPVWDTSGIRVQGRFQFKTGCMVRRGNDCGCFLVDTEIEEHERSSCTKGEYLSRVEGNVGYGEWDNNRIFQISFQELQLSATDKVKQVLAGDNPSVFLRGRPSICDDDVVATTGRTICAEERISSTRTAFPIRSGVLDPSSEIQGFQPISWRGDSMAVWYIYLPKSTKDGMPSFEYHVEVLGTHDDSRSSWVWKKLTSMWRYLTSTENPVLYRLDLPLHVLEDQAKSPNESVVEKGEVPLATSTDATTEANSHISRAVQSSKRYDASKSRKNLRDVQWANQQERTKYMETFISAVPGAEAIARVTKEAAAKTKGVRGGISCFFGDCSAKDKQNDPAHVVPTLSWTISSTSEQSSKSTFARAEYQRLVEKEGGKIKDKNDLAPLACPKDGSESEHRQDQCSKSTCTNLSEPGAKFRVSARLSFQRTAERNQPELLSPIGSSIKMLPTARYLGDYAGPTHATDWNMNDYSAQNPKVNRANMGHIKADLMFAARKAHLIKAGEAFTQCFYGTNPPTANYDQTKGNGEKFILEKLVIEGPLIYLNGRETKTSETQHLILMLQPTTALDMFSYSYDQLWQYYVIKNVKRLSVYARGKAFIPQIKGEDDDHLYHLLIPASSQTHNYFKSWTMKPWDMIAEKGYSLVDKAVSTWKTCLFDPRIREEPHCLRDAKDPNNAMHKAFHNKGGSGYTPNKMYSEVTEYRDWQCQCHPTKAEAEATRSDFEKQLVNAIKVAQLQTSVQAKTYLQNRCAVKIYTVNDDTDDPVSTSFLGTFDCSHGPKPNQDVTADFCLPWLTGSGDGSDAGSKADEAWAPKTKGGKDLFRWQLVQCVGKEPNMWQKCDDDASTRALTAPLELKVNDDDALEAFKAPTDLDPSFQPIETFAQADYKDAEPPTGQMFSVESLADVSGNPNRLSLKDAGAYMLPRKERVSPEQKYLPISIVLHKNRGPQNLNAIEKEDDSLERMGQRVATSEGGENELEPLVDSLASLVDADEREEQAAAPRKQAGATAGGALQPADYGAASLEREREGVSTSFPDLERRRRDEAIVEISREQQDDTLMHSMHALQMRAALLRKEDDRLLRTSNELAIPQPVTGRARERRDLADGAERRMGLLMRGLAACIERDWDVTCLSGDPDLEALRDDAYEHRRIEAEWAVAQRTSNGTKDMLGLERADADELAQLKAVLARERPEWEQQQSGADGEELERWDWPWAKDDGATAKTDPRVSFMGRMRSWFGLETQKEAEEIAFLEAKKVGYAFPHYSESTRECYLGVKPGFLEQCRSQPMRPEVDEQGDTVEGECKTAIDCTCDRFDLRGTATADGDDVDSDPFQMPCEEKMTEFFSELVPHASVGRFIDPNRYKWEVGCYIPTRSSWFWKDAKDTSKSKCGCFLVDTLLTAEATEETEGQMCSYAPMEVDSSKVTGAMEGAEQADSYTASAHAGKDMNNPARGGQE